jgi:hypothetical protein
MRVVRFALVLLAAFTLSSSFVIPADDVLETPYDESEALPYETTPSFSIIQQESALALRLEFPLQFHRDAKRKMLAEQSERDAHPFCDSVIVLDHSFRC